MKLLTGLWALIALAQTASAEFFPVPANQLMLDATSLSAAPIEDGGVVTRIPPPVYSSIPGPYATFAAGSFSAADDYTSTLAGGGNFICDTVKFVGGVTAAGGILDFFLLDPASTTVSTFGVTFPQAGDFIWTITLNSGNGLPAAKVGQLGIQTRTGSSGHWFATTTPPSAGSNNIATGFGSPTRFGAFELETPEPGAVALLTSVGTLAFRRRRRR